MQLGAALLMLNVFFVLFAEDLSNLTASDVMNRVNLGYLQGTSTVDQSLIMRLLLMVTFLFQMSRAITKTPCPMS